MRKSVVILFSFLALSVRFGVAQVPAADAVPTASALRIGAGDMLDISVFNSAELSGHFRVNEKGEITVPLLGAVPVSGETAEEVGEQLGALYRAQQILQDSKGLVGVFVSGFASQGITVSGEVKTASVVPAFGVRMLHDVILAAGGVTPAASSKIIITRKGDPAHPITVEYNPTSLSPVIPQIQMFPGDQILVPRAGMVYALGNIGRPGLYVLEGRDTLTVEKLMALTGGYQHATATSKVHLVRSASGGVKTDTIFDLKAIIKGKAPDIALQDGDILYVPTSTKALVIQQAISSALGIGTQAATYRAIQQ